MLITRIVYIIYQTLVTLDGVEGFNGKAFTCSCTYMTEYVVIFFYVISNSYTCRVSNKMSRIFLMSSFDFQPHMKDS